MTFHKGRTITWPVLNTTVSLCIHFQQAIARAEEGRLCRPGWDWAAVLTPSSAGTWLSLKAKAQHQQAEKYF